MSNYATKSNLKSATGIDTSDFPKEADVTSLKSHLYKLDYGKLKTTLIDLSKVSVVVKHKVVKKTVYDKLVKKLMLFRLIILAV